MQLQMQMQPKMQSKPQSKMLVDLAIVCKYVWCVNSAHTAMVLAEESALHALPPLQAFVGWDWRKLSGAIIVHAVCGALERTCNWFMTSHPQEPNQTALSRVFDKK